MRSFTNQLFAVLTLCVAVTFSSCTESAKEVTPESKANYQVSNKTQLEDGDMVFLTWINDRKELSFVKVNEDLSLDPNLTNKSEATLMKTHVVGDNKYAFEKDNRYMQQEGNTVVMSTSISDAAIYMLNEDNSLVTTTSSAVLFVNEGIITFGTDYSVIHKRKVIVIMEE